MNKPLVSITIPTKNSEDTIEQCLSSVIEQDYKNIEIIVIDSYSKDKTVEIAKKFNAKIIQTEWKLLGARYLGVMESKGEYVLLLDSDQFLNKDCISRAINKMYYEGLDMLCLEEYAYSTTTIIEKLFEADRILVHKLSDIHLDPESGVMLPRFFKRELLVKIFRNIPDILYPIVVAHDHAIIYYEAYKISKKVGILGNAVKHKEPSSLFELLKKNYNYGKTTKDLIKTGLYTDLIKRKTGLRKGLNSDIRLGLESSLLLMLKGVGYYIGLIFG